MSADDNRMEESSAFDQANEIVPPVDLLVMGDHAYHQRSPIAINRTLAESTSDDSAARFSNLTVKGDEEKPSVLLDQDAFIHDVAVFFNQQDLSDVLLIVGEFEFYAHKFVLAKSSDVFKTMLYGPMWAAQNETSQKLVLQETPDCEQIFSKFLQYLYTAKVELSIESAVGILRLADKYNVSSLKKLCVTFMKENSKSPKLKNAIIWYPWAKLLNVDDLVNQCRQTMSWHAEQIMRMDVEDEWTSYDLEFVRDMLSSDEMIVRDEFAVFQSLSRWLLEPCRFEQLAENAATLLPLVRFPQMLVTDLFRCEQSELYKMECTHDLLHRLLAASYRFRELYPKSAELNLLSDFSNSSFYYPRDYLTLVVDMVQMHNTLRFGIQVDVKMYNGAVPQERKDADWKIRYSKHHNTWQVTFMCHDSALVFHGEARMRATVMIHDRNDNVIQVERLPESLSDSSLDGHKPFMRCVRGKPVHMSINVNDPDNSQTMVVIVKPIP